MSDKALNPATLELTQKIQLHFPRNIDPDILRRWNGVSAETLTATLFGTFAKRPNVPTLLSFLGVIALPATKKFVAKDNFRIGKAGIGLMGENFQSWFFGKTEESAPEATLRYHKLNEDSFDAPILEELGGKAETTLAHLFHLLSIQSKGQDGVLLVNGDTNIFYVYIRDQAEGLRAVNARWNRSRHYWSVGALTVTNPIRLAAGDRVFSSNPA